MRDRRDTHAYGWSPRSFIEEGLLEYVFDDLESGQLSFIEQVVRLQLLRHCAPLEGDTEGRVVLLENEDPTAPMNWDGALRALRRRVREHDVEDWSRDFLDALAVFHDRAVEARS